MRSGGMVIVAVALFLYSSFSFAGSLDIAGIASETGAAVAAPGSYLPSLFHSLRSWSGASRQELHDRVTPQDLSGVSISLDEMSYKIADGVAALADPHTRVAPSHVGHPGYQDAAFVYDKAVDAMVLHAAGFDTQARALLDYFDVRLRIPLREVRQQADANGIYGILKLFPSVDDPRGLGLLNAVNCRSASEAGEGQLEYWTTPGPVAFMVMAFLQVDRKKYLASAAGLGETLLLMQRDDGAVIDGDRDGRNVHTEPHMDSYSAFMMLFDVTGDGKWKTAADRAWEWFVRHVYHPADGIIDQGMRPAGPSAVFATDAYSWTIAGRAGDRLPLDAAERLIHTMLRRSLTRVSLELPDGKEKTLTLVDFADVQDARIAADRGGFRPMGSVEWIGGVILALQKTAARFALAGDDVAREKAAFYKALAEYFSAQSMDAFYALEGVRGLVSFYATGQWVSTGHGWKTPYFYVKDRDGKPVLKGGSTIGSWPVLPLKRINPFILDDPYGRVYGSILLDDAMRQKAADYVAGLVRTRAFSERVPTEMASDVGDIPEMWRYNVQMFNAINRGDHYAAILWAGKVVSNPVWRRLAAEQQARKQRDIGGIVDYPWGRPPSAARAAQAAIQKYPLLNEMGAAMWGLAVAHYKLGDRQQAKAWMRTLLETVPFHQIFAPAGPGYWNALVSWQENPGGTFLDAEMGGLLREILQEAGRSTALPPVYAVP